MHRDVRGPDWNLTPGRPLLDLATVLESFVGERAYLLEEGLDKRLQAIADQPYVYFDCSGARHQPSPIYVSNHAEPLRLVLPSIGEMVQVWIDLIEDGVWTTDGDGTWAGGYLDALPEHVLKLGIY